MGHRLNTRCWTTDIHWPSIIQPRCSQCSWVASDPGIRVQVSCGAPRILRNQNTRRSHDPSHDPIGFLNPQLQGHRWPFELCFLRGIPGSAFAPLGFSFLPYHWPRRYPSRGPQDWLVVYHCAACIHRLSIYHHNQNELSLNPFDDWKIPVGGFNPSEKY